MVSNIEQPPDARRQHLESDGVGATQLQKQSERLWHFRMGVQRVDATGLVGMPC
jgi:hypothetical protein